MGKELKALNRAELIEIIYQLKKSEQELQKENVQLKEELEIKRINLSHAGSIADAAIALSDVFGAAQAAANMYLGEIEQRYESLDRDYAAYIEEAQEQANSIIENAVQQRDEIIEEARRAYALLRQYEDAVEDKKAELSYYSNWEQ